MIFEMLDALDGVSQRWDLLSVALVVIGVILTVVAIIDTIPHQYAAPVEWLGVFCLMSGLTYMYSVGRTLLLAFAAFLFGCGQAAPTAVEADDYQLSDSEAPTGGDNDYPSWH